MTVSLQSIWDTESFAEIGKLEVGQLAFGQMFENSRTFCEQRRV